MWRSIALNAYIPTMHSQDDWTAVNVVMLVKAKAEVISMTQIWSLEDVIHVCANLSTVRPSFLSKFYKPPLLVCVMHDSTNSIPHEAFQGLGREEAGEGLGRQIPKIPFRDSTVLQRSIILQVCLKCESHCELRGFGKQFFPVDFTCKHQER